MVRFQDDTDGPDFDEQLDEPIPNFKWRGQTPEEVREDTAKQRQAAQSHAMNLVAQQQQDAAGNPISADSNAGANPDMISELHYLRDYKSRMDRYLTDHSVVPQSPERAHADHLTAFINDPEGFKQNMTNRIATELEERQVGQEFRDKYPDLLEYEPLIIQHAQRQMALVNSKGQHVSLRQAIHLGIQSFLAKYPQLQANGKAAANPKQTGREVMRLDVKGAAPSQSTSGAKEIWKMSPDEFDAYDDRVMRHLNHYD